MMIGAEDIVRHEAGHAVVGHVLGRPVKTMTWRARRAGAEGDVDLGHLAGSPDHLTILSAGYVADYLNSRMPRIDDANAPLVPTFDDMVDWARDIFDQRTRGARMVAERDLRAMRRIRTGGRFDPLRDPSIADGPREDVQRAIEILNEHWDTLCELVDYAAGREPGIGPRELRRFFDGDATSRWVRLLDKPRVWMVRLEQRKFRDRNT